jgi:hypothetical protein
MRNHEPFVALMEDELATETNSTERLSPGLPNHANSAQDEGDLQMSNIPWDAGAVVDPESDTVEDHPPQPKTRKRKRKSIAAHEPTLLEPAEIVRKSRRLLRGTAKDVKAPPVAIVQPSSSDVETPNDLVESDPDETGLHSTSVEVSNSLLHDAEANWYFSQSPHLQLVPRSSKLLSQTHQNSNAFVYLSINSLRAHFGTLQSRLDGKADVLCSGGLRLRRPVN